MTTLTATLAPPRTLLNSDRKSNSAIKFQSRLSSLIVGQERAVKRISDLYQIFLAGINNPLRPVGTMLFLGPTGSGKTRVVEAAAEVLYGHTHGLLRIDCAEYQHSHEIAKLIGSPPGYLGHRETPALLIQVNIDRYHTTDCKLSFLLFDEIEKASDSLWQLLLGILDTATLTLGNNTRVDFSRCIIVMTSNLGSREMTELISGGIGFAPSGESQHKETGDDLDKEIYKTAIAAARRKFSPEFMNRIDKVVVFRRLKENQLRTILEIELAAIERRVNCTLACNEDVKEMLVREGYDPRYGARHLRRSLERKVVFPLANLLATGQLIPGATIEVETHPENGKLLFYKTATEIEEEAQAA